MDMKESILFVLIAMGLAACLVGITSCASKPIQKNCIMTGSYQDAQLFDCEDFQ